LCVTHVRIFSLRGFFSPLCMCHSLHTALSFRFKLSRQLLRAQPPFSLFRSTSFFCEQLLQALFLWLIPALVWVWGFWVLDLTSDDLLYLYFNSLTRPSSLEILFFPPDRLIRVFHLLFPSTCSSVTFLLPHLQLTTRLFFLSFSSGVFLKSSATVPRPLFLSLFPRSTTLQAWAVWVHPSCFPLPCCPPFSL